ncbi:hypothetical protein GGF37_007592, partial [Kickxella alabastrina]
MFMVCGRVRDARRCAESAWRLFQAATSAAGGGQFASWRGAPPMSLVNSVALEVGAGACVVMGKLG